MVNCDTIEKGYYSRILVNCLTIEKGYEKRILVNCESQNHNVENLESW